MDICSPLPPPTSILFYYPFRGKLCHNTVLQRFHFVRHFKQLSYFYSHKKTSVRNKNATKLCLYHWEYFGKTPDFPSLLFVCLLPILLGNFHEMSTLTETYQSTKRLVKWAVWDFLLAISSFRKHRFRTLSTFNIERCCRLIGAAKASAAEDVSGSRAT